MKKSTSINHPSPKASILPKETLEIAERQEILLAGVLGIDDYHTEKVRVKTTLGIVEAYGSSVSLCWAGEKRLLLRGHFEGLKFENTVPFKGGCQPCR
jgi:hypothetical protein